MSIPAVAPNGFHEKLYPEMYDRFRRDVADHLMTILHDDGLYRHLVFRRAHTGMYWFEVVTWPSSLTIRGDMGTFVFARTSDMFGFFGTGDINPGYWAEKTPSYGQDRQIRAYDPDLFKRTVQTVADQWLETHPVNNRAAFQECLQRDVLEDAGDYHTDMEAALNFEWDDEQVFPEFYQYDMRNYTPQFLWCCLAIPYAIRHYRHAKEDHRG